MSTATLPLKPGDAGRAQSAGGVAPGDVLDLDHLRTPVGQDAGRRGHEGVLGDLEDADAFHDVAHRCCSGPVPGRHLRPPRAVQHGRAPRCGIRGRHPGRRDPWTSCIRTDRVTFSDFVKGGIVRRLLSSGEPDRVPGHRVGGRRQRVRRCADGREAHRHGRGGDRQHDPHRRDRRRRQPVRAGDVQGRRRRGEGSGEVHQRQRRHRGPEARGGLSTTRSSNANDDRATRSSRRASRTSRSSAAPCCSSRNVEDEMNCKDIDGQGDRAPRRRRTHHRA